MRGLKGEGIRGGEKVSLRKGWLPGPICPDKIKRGSSKFQRSTGPFQYASGGRGEGHVKKIGGWKE